MYYKNKTMSEYYLLQVEYFDFNDKSHWIDIDSKDKCDLCYQNKAEFSTYQCASWVGGKQGGVGGGDIGIEYCSDCRNKKIRKRITKEYVENYNNDTLHLLKL